MVVSLLALGARAETSAVRGERLAEDATPGPRAGLVVSKAVGNSVVRHRVSRLLRHALGECITAGAIGDGEIVVVRALPACATSSVAEIRHDIDHCIRRIRRAQAKRPAPQASK